MPAERRDQTYHCQCKGCPNGEGSAFTGAPQEWFERKGFSTPRNCPDCRAWNKRQVDETFRCETCREPIRVSRNYKISYHKGTGPWKNPTQCRRRESGQVRQRTTRKRKRPEDELISEEEWVTYFGQMSLTGNPIPVEPRKIANNPVYYRQRQIIGDEGPETRLEHIEHHMPRSANSWMTDDVPDPERIKSPSQFLGEFDRLDADALGHLGAMLGVVDPDYVREHAVGAKIVRHSLLEGGYMELTVLREIQGHPGIYEVISTYDNIPVPIPQEYRT